MLKELKFVQGSVAKKDFVPALTHFSIENGTVRGYNGVMAICSPIPFNISCKPKADPLIRAINNCEETVQLTMMASGRLSIKSGKFKAFVDCVEGDTPHVMPSGKHVAIDGAALLQAFQTIYPVIGDDASRPWSNGVLLLGQSAFATNNVVLVEYWTGAEVPLPINVPRAAIKEMLRVNEAPVSIQMDDNSITFHYSESRWIRTQLLETKWPDLRKVLDRPSTPKGIDERIFQAMEIIKPFCDKLGRVMFKPGRICTHEDENEGAGYDLDGFDHTGIYSFEMLACIKDVAKMVDWSTYPNPCMFFGDRARGAIIGMKA
jgi:DNA polymerase III sliding clamp (beta) subunit (PCNA family)